MSSYTIPKEEYIKAAGVVAGIASIKTGGRSFWIYDYEKGRPMNEQDFYEKFVECFNMNSLSVQEQYGDPTPETDSEEYKSTFKAAMQAGKQAVIAGNVKSWMIDLRDFFHCAIYQTENEAYMWKMRIFFDSVIDQLIEIAFPHECKSWGSITI